MLIKELSSFKSRWFKPSFDFKLINMDVYVDKYRYLTRKIYYIKLIIFKYCLRISQNVNIGYISSNTYTCIYII